MASWLDKVTCRLLGHWDIVWSKSSLSFGPKALQECQLGFCRGCDRVVGRLREVNESDPGREPKPGEHREGD